MDFTGSAGPKEVVVKRSLKGNLRGWGMALVLAAAPLVLTGCFDVNPPGPTDLSAVEKQVFDAINSIRQANGLYALTTQAGLGGVARAHSDDMLARDYLSHVNPEGKNPGDRIAAAGIAVTAWGENIAMAQGLADPVEDIVQGWMDSPGHRENILRPGWTHTGVGVAQSGSTFYFTQVFAILPVTKSAPAPASGWLDVLRALVFPGG